LIGDGPEKANLEALARTLGIANRTVFHGAIYGHDAKRDLLARAHIGVIPGRGGLAIQEMMAQGVPVVSGVADGTERDLIRHEQNGYLIEGFPTAHQLTAALQDFRARTPSQRTAFATAALDTVVHHSNISMMARGFVTGLVAATRS
jgi:glycosyltransferase involved in cell wall biosynthesis